MNRKPVIAFFIGLCAAAGAFVIYCGLTSMETKNQNDLLTLVQTPSAPEAGQPAVRTTTADAAPANVQLKCPIRGGDIVKDAYVDYNGKRIYFCCPGCDKEFMKSPDTYIGQMEAAGIVLASTTPAPAATGCPFEGAAPKPVKHQGCDEHAPGDAGCDMEGHGQAKAGGGCCPS